MCEFVSWKEVKCPDGSTQILFLTSDDVFNTSKGRKLQKHTTPGDFIGHGAIDFYYDLDGKGVNHECTDFWTPKNFPPEIVEAIKAGKFFLLAPVPAGILRAALYADYVKKRAPGAPLYADYEKKRAPLDADYEKKRAALYADYMKKRAPLYADYEKKRAPLYAAYMKKCAALYADYEKKRAPLDADYMKKRAPLYADYLKKRAPLDADYEKKWDALDADCEKKRDALYADYMKKRAALDADTWLLVSVPENRSLAWQ